jgi:hypothetical protein
MTGQVLMTRQLLARILRQGLRKQFWRYRIVGAVVLVLGALAIWQGSSSPSVLAGALAAGVMLTALPELMIWLTLRRLHLGDGQAWFYRFSSDGVSQANPLATVTIRWQQVRSVIPTPDAWCLRLRQGGILAVPRAAMDPAQHTQVEQLFTGVVAPR